VYVFGRGREGQLGIQATGESVAAYRNKPVKLPDTQFKGKLIKVSAGGDHTGALVEE
jgi:alpha-tubulin suppressor-like RCC1 family protein